MIKGLKGALFIVAILSLIISLVFKHIILKGQTTWVGRSDLVTLPLWRGLKAPITIAYAEVGSGIGFLVAVTLLVLVQRKYP